jgi:hypothetical protein
VWNLLDGIDVYHVVEAPIWVRKLCINIRQNNVKQLDFACNDEYAISGSDNGEVSIWEVSSGVRLQVLIHGPGKQTAPPTSLTSNQSPRVDIESQAIQTVSARTFPSL